MTMCCRMFLFNHTRTGRTGMRVLVPEGADGCNCYGTREVISGHGRGQGTGRLDGEINRLKKGCVLRLRLGALGNEVWGVGDTAGN